MLRFKRKKSFNHGFKKYFLNKNYSIKIFILQNKLKTYYFMKLCVRAWPSTKASSFFYVNVKKGLENQVKDHRSSDKEAKRLLVLGT